MEDKNKKKLSSIIPFVIIGVILIVGLFVFNPFNNSKEVAFNNDNIRLEKNHSIQLSLKKSSGSVRYKSSDSSIVSVNAVTGYAKALKVGTVTITAYIEDDNTIYDECTIEVYIEDDNTVYIDKVTFNENYIELYVGDSKTISYTITPSNATEKLIWGSTSQDIVSIKDGVIKANSEGTATIKAVTSKGNIATCKVVVSKKNETQTPTEPKTPKEQTTPKEPTTPSKPQIEKLIISSSKLSVYVGKSKKIEYRVEPSDAEIKSVKWSSSDTSIATVDNNGNVKGIKEGSATIILSVNGNINGNVIVTVSKEKVEEPKATTNGKIWGYTDSKMVNPTRAGTSFFTNLANKGVGSISGNVYTYSGYTYDISKSNLIYDGRTSLIRIYYPQGLDLSNVNTFAFLGGTGEQNMKGMFSAADKDTSLIKSSGIVILVSSPGTYRYQDAINATNFVKAITKQKSGKKNSVGGYSLGGPAAGSAMIHGNYDRLFIVHSKVELSHTSQLKDKKIYVYAPKGDAKMGGSTRTTLTSFKNDGARKNLTLITNDSSNIRSFSDYFTIVNPGSAQGSGHGYVNFTNGNLFAFACSD